MTFSVHLLRVELFCAIQPDANIHLLNMMCFAARAVAALETPDLKVILRRHNKASIDLIRKLFPSKKGETVRIGERNMR